jgi:hypothetical protein
MKCGICGGPADLKGNELKCRGDCGTQLMFEFDPNYEPKKDAYQRVEILGDPVAYIYRRKEK